MKNIIKATISISICASSMLASNITEKIIEAKRIQKIDAIIEKENQVYSRLIKYIKETADLTPTRREIQQKYNLSADAFTNYKGETCINSSGICNDNTTGGITIDFDINNNQIILGNILGDVKDLSNIEKDRFENSPSRDASNETINNKYDRKYTITDNKVLDFTIKIVESAKTNNKIILQVDEPSALNRTKMWLKPVGDGTFDTLIWSDVKRKWQSKGTITDKYNPNGAGISPELTFYLEDKFNPQTTIGQKGWVANVESNYGFSQYKHTGTEWVQITVADNQVYEFTDITDLLNDHMEDPIGSVISGVMIPNTSAVVEFTKYSKYWATKDGMFFVIQNKNNLPLTVKNGARAWTKDGNLILFYDSQLNTWVVQLESTEDWKNKYDYISHLDIVRIVPEYKNYRNYNTQIIVALDGSGAYATVPSEYTKLSPTFYGLKINATVVDVIHNGAYSTTVEYAPYKSPSGAVMLLFVDRDADLANYHLSYFDENSYLMLITDENFWISSRGIMSNYKVGTARTYRTSLGSGTRVGSAFVFDGLPVAQAGQTLIADRDGSSSYYHQYITYTGQTNGTWTSPVSGDAIINYYFDKFEDTFPLDMTSKFKSGDVALIKGNYYRYVGSDDWRYENGHTYGIIPVKYNDQIQLGGIDLDYIGVTSDGKYYYTKVYPADTYINAMKHCSVGYYRVDKIPSIELTTAGGGEIPSQGLDYIWTDTTKVAGTREVFNGTSTKTASENTSYPYRCYMPYGGWTFK